jgi:hypothetical protein
MRDNGTGTCVLPLGDRNVIKQEVEKILKYKDPTVEIQRMWNVKTAVIPVITGATEAVYFEIIQKMPEQHTGKVPN